LWQVQIATLRLLRLYSLVASGKLSLAVSLLALRILLHSRWSQCTRKYLYIDNPSDRARPDRRHITLQGGLLSVRHAMT
jgi:hypothetical protein